MDTGTRIIPQPPTSTRDTLIAVVLIAVIALSVAVVILAGTGLLSG